MSAQITQVGNSWSISGDVLIDAATTLLAMSQALPMAADTKIDFSAVTNIDTSTISLILEWQRRAKKENQTIQLVNLPTNLISLTALYGVAELIS
jgi:phospholipid transport system transporter-binding protein